MAFNFYEWSMRFYLNWKTRRQGEFVGEDPDGNRYYRQKKVPKGYRERRWVVFDGGESEATRVPPEWHAWLHFQRNDLPSGDNPFRRQWQKEHVPNLTGTTGAYLPPGHALKGGQRDRATGDYEAWTPN